jgi:DNA transformation protein
MFGGWGIYLDGLMFGLIAGDRLYLKVDAVSEPAWRAAGGAPFVYEAKGSKRVAMSYFSPPSDALDSPDQMQPWGRMALDAALRARAHAAKRPSRPAASSAPVASKRKPKSSPKG